MTWLIAHHTDPAGQGNAGDPVRGLPSVLASGTMVAEFSSAAIDSATGPLLHYARGDARPRMLTVMVAQDGRLHVLHRQGSATNRISVGLERDRRPTTFRLTYHWDCARARTLLTLENLGSGTIRQQEQRGAVPLTHEDVVAMVAIGDAGGAGGAGTLDWFAFRAGYHPPGIGPSFSGTTPILTPDGLRAAASIRAGDLVITADAGPQPVLWSGSVEVPACGSYRPVRLIGPDVDRGTDSLIAPDHRIALRGEEIEYMFGEEEVLIEAARLDNGVSVSRDYRAATIRYHGLLLAEHHVLTSDGFRLESLFAGNLRNHPDLMATTLLADLVAAGGMPRHRRPARRDLAGYEVMSLQSRRLQALSPIAA